MNENQEEPTLYTVSYMCSGTNQARFINVSRPTRMPCQTPSWTEFLICPVCTNEFSAGLRVPITLRCGHTICKKCLASIQQCPYDQTAIAKELDDIPINYALLQLVSTSAGLSSTEPEILPSSVQSLSADDLQCYKLAKSCIEELALNLKPSGSIAGYFSGPMQRKLVTLINCQLIEDEGRARLIRAARSLGERTVIELILYHQNPNQLSANLWAAVRARGCQFLGPSMQEEVLKLILTALEEGASMCRKALVIFVVQKLEPSFPQASKTNIGHVVQLLYRASCFVVTKRDGDSSMMQLQEEFRIYKSLRKEHDAQIVLIATEAGLRIAPDQWSSLLYGNLEHKSDMQSLIDKQQTPQSFGQSIQELMIALQRTGDPAKLSDLRTHMTNLAAIESSSESTITPSWKESADAVEATKLVVNGLIELVLNHRTRKPHDSGHMSSYKISLCRDLSIRGSCPRGTTCTFAHSDEELERFRLKMKKSVNRSNMKGPSSCSVNGGSSGKWGQGATVSFTKSLPHQMPAKPLHNLTAASSDSTPSLSQNQTGLNVFQPSSPMSSRFACNGSNFGGPIVTGYQNYPTSTSAMSQQFRTRSRYSSDQKNSYSMPFSHSSSASMKNMGNGGYFQAAQPMTRNDDSSGFFGMNSEKCKASMMWRSGSVFGEIENKSPNSSMPKNSSSTYSSHQSPTNRSELTELELQRLMMYRNQADDNQAADDAGTDQMWNVPGYQFDISQSPDSVLTISTDDEFSFDFLPRPSATYGAIGSNQSAWSQARPWNDVQSTLAKRFEAMGTNGSGDDAMAKMAGMGDVNPRMNLMPNGCVSSRSHKESFMNIAVEPSQDMNPQASTVPRPLFDRQQKNLE